MSNLVETAKQGDPAAIAQLINRSLQPKGITAKVALRDDCLKIILEASPAPSGELSDYIYKGISNLDIPTIQGLTVYGRNSGDEFPAWTREFSLSAFDELAAQTEQSTDQDAVYCPRCQSSQLMVSKKGFDVGSAAVGALLFGSVGLAGGMIGSNEVMLSCIKCGHQWQPAKETQTPKVISAARSTPARLKQPTFRDRLTSATSVLVVMGVIALIFHGIPMIVSACILIGLAAAFLFLTEDGKKQESWAGQCPHCDKEISAPKNKTNTTCTHCKGEIIIEGQRFYAVEQ